MTRALLLLVLAVLFAPRHACGQIADSTGRTCLVPASASYERRIDRRRSTRAYRMTFVAVPLIVGGLVMKPFDDDFRELRNDHAGQLPAGAGHTRRVDVGPLGGGRGGVVPHPPTGVSADVSRRRICA